MFGLLRHLFTDSFWLFFSAAPSQIPSTANIAATMADASAPSSSSTNCGISSNSNYEPLSESDLSSEELAERLIHRRSSIDHLLPEQPDYEQQQQQDTNNKLWTASTTATSVVEQKVEDDEHKQRMDGITEEGGFWKPFFGLLPFRGLFCYALWSS